MSDPRISASAYCEADVAFHVALLAASGNQAFSLTMLAVGDGIRLHLDEAMAKRSFRAIRAKITDEHRALLQAVGRGNVESLAALVRSHLEFYAT